LLSFSQSPEYEIRIDPTETVLPLGYIEFKPKAGEVRKIPVNIGRVVADDVDFSGRVKIIEALKADSNTLHYFMMNEAYAYFSGEYKFQGNEVKVRCYLNDAETDDLIYEKKYTAKRNRLRMVAHKLADELVYQLFGEKGIAQTKIVFVSKTSGIKEIYQMDYDGANVSQITKNYSMNLFPCWLRKSSAIMYTSYKTGYPQLYTKALSTGKEAMFLKSRFLNIGPDYNAIDGEIVYTSSVKGNTEIFRMSEAGGKPVRLTYSNSLEASPSWSPNGYEIVFTSGRAGNPMLYIMDRDGSNLRRLTYDGSYNTSPAWSPKGDKIAFCRMNARGQMDIFTINPTGKNLTRLTSDLGSNESPSWSPDGRAIVFTSTRLGRPEIFNMREDGSNQKQITIFSQNSAPNWSYFLN
jgi:TolB protein